MVLEKKTMIEFKEIYDDYRGKIFLLNGFLPDEREVTVFTTKKGYARGGCIHRYNSEYCSVISGTILYYIEDEPVATVLLTGESIRINRGMQHYFIAISKDTVVMEWGATPMEKITKGKWRSIVDGINSKRRSEVEGS